MATEASSDTKRRLFWTTFMSGLNQIGLKRPLNVISTHIWAAEGLMKKYPVVTDVPD